MSMSPRVVWNLITVNPLVGARNVLALAGERQPFDDTAA
jgi:hypothetical protein